ncbi:MAG: DUF452 family protein [Candidatus Gastranaerophilales bacterium]|nr:DUF452 family protein [Candidatus Gastranaerophilales bacterium]
MNYKWLKHTNSNSLIIFFNGWGMDDFIVSSLDCCGFDVIVFYDYNNLDTDISFDEYSEKHIIAWSMGVMISQLFDFGDIKSATAICGTPNVIDDKYGIPERIYNLTVKGFNELSAGKFMARMFIDTPPFEKFSDRIFESQKTELIKMLEYKDREPVRKINFTKAIVSDSDRIIPYNNQINYWKTPVIIHAGHCPFLLYKKWAELL